MKFALFVTATVFATLPVAIAAHSIPDSDLLRLGLTPPDTVFRHGKELNLLPEQEAKLKDLYDTAKTQRGPLETQLAAQRSILEKMVDGAAGTLEDAEKALNDLLQTEADLKRLQLRTILGINQTLNPDQRTKAVALSRKDAELKPIIESKLAKLQEAVDGLGFAPTPAVKQRGQSIERLLESGELEAVNQALEAAMADLGVAEVNNPVPVIDFTAFAPGNIDPAALEQRFQAVEEKVAKVERLPILLQFKQAHDALEAAKGAEDAISAGQILTWAESVLK